MITEVKKYFAPPRVPQPFWVELAGISYCDYTYRIHRTVKEASVFVLEYVISGEGTICVNSQEYHPSAGDFYLLQPGTAHEYFSSSSNPWTKIFVNAYGPLCADVISRYGLSSTVLMKNCDVRKPLQELIDIANAPDLNESQIMAQCAAKFVEIVASTTFYSKRTHFTDNEEVNLMCDFLHANTNRMISIADLSRLINRSPDYTMKLFKKHMGYSPYDYHIQTKMEICKRRLCVSNDSIAAIAGDLGYSDSFYFSKLFKNRCGMSPRQYRAQFANAPADMI